MLHDSAMMLYLDMEEMTGERHNENLARELCELFTLGVGNYREADVREIPAGAGPHPGDAGLRVRSSRGRAVVSARTRTTRG